MQLQEKNELEEEFRFLEIPRDSFDFELNEERQNGISVHSRTQDDVKLNDDTWIILHP